MSKFKVRLTKTETYVHEEIVEAKNRDAAVFAVSQSGFEFPEVPTKVEDASDAEEILDLSGLEIEELRRWVCRVTFFDEDEDGIAEVTARFRMRDGDAFMDRVGAVISRENAKSLICGIIDSFAYPCEDYAKDFDDPDSVFELNWEYLPQSHTLEISATIRT